MTYKNPAGNFIFPIASHIDIVTVAKYAASANEDERLWQENRMNLYPLTKDEANLLLGLLKNALTQASDVPMDDGNLDQLKLTGIVSVIKSGGLKVYVGSVTDQDGDSTWELTSSLRRIHDWADEMSIVSFEVPKTYRISVGRSEFGFPKRLTRKPDPEMSELSD